MTLVDDLRAALDPVVLFERATGLVALPWQKSYLRATGNVAVLKARQTGATTSAAAIALHCALYHEAVDVVLISRSQKQSGEIIKKVRHAARRLGIRFEQDSATMLQLVNGSRIVSLPGTPASVRGYSVGHGGVMIIDEAAFVPPETWVAARALIASGGRWIVQSTPAGQYGDFFELVQAADPDWLHLSIRADEVPHIPAEYLDAQRKAMTPDAYAQEFEAVFGKVAASLFTLDQIDAMFQERETA